MKKIIFTVITAGLLNFSLPIMADNAPVMIKYTDGRIDINQSVDILATDLPYEITVQSNEEKNLFFQIGSTPATIRTIYGSTCDAYLFEVKYDARSGEYTKMGGGGVGNLKTPNEAIDLKKDLTYKLELPKCKSDENVRKFELRTKAK